MQANTCAHLIVRHPGAIKAGRQEGYCVKQPSTKPVNRDARQALIEAARLVFVEQGYSGATTRAIAQRAGVNEVTIFRHFASKANLFKEAVFQPFDRYLAEYIQQEFTGQHNTPLTESWRSFSGGLFALLDENSALLNALIVACNYDAGDIFGVHDLTSLDSYFEHASAAIAKISGKRGHPTRDPEIVARLVFGLVSSVALFRGWLFPQGLAPIEKVIEVMQRFGEQAFGLTEDQSTAGLALDDIRVLPEAD